MITFNDLHNGDYIFLNDGEPVAIGTREQDGFHLLHQDQMISFANAMQAYSHVRSIYEPFVVSPGTMELFNTPAPGQVDKLSKYKDNPSLQHITKEVFHAHLSN
jgi:hypothetical protein